jgi:hypothetical protein
VRKGRRNRRLAQRLPANPSPASTRGPRSHAPEPGASNPSRQWERSTFRFCMFVCLAPEIPAQRVPSKVKLETRPALVG